MLKKYNLKVSNLYISQVKRKCGGYANYTNYAHLCTPLKGKIKRCTPLLYIDNYWRILSLDCVPSIDTMHPLTAGGCILSENRRLEVISVVDVASLLNVCVYLKASHLDIRLISCYNNTVINNTVIDNGIIYERRVWIWQ